MSSRELRIEGTSIASHSVSGRASPVSNGADRGVLVALLNEKYCLASEWSALGRRQA